MAERLADGFIDAYEECEFRYPPEPIQYRRTRFFDDGEREPRVRTRQRGEKSGHPLPARKTLFDLPSGEILVLCSEAGFPHRLLSEQAVELLELSFGRTVRLSGLDRAGLEKWLRGEHAFQQDQVVKRIRGRIFEEVATREFVRSHPNYFLTNPVLTSKILKPIVESKAPGQFSLPDHLVIRKDGPMAIVVGFMEDKKYFASALELFAQLERQWSLWYQLTVDLNLQRQLREGILQNIPTMPPRVSVAPTLEGSIWLSMAKGVSIVGNSLPAWVKYFNSSVSGESINNLADLLIKKRFLPRLLDPQLQV